MQTVYERSIFYVNGMFSNREIPSKKNMHSVKFPDQSLL